MKGSWFSGTSAFLRRERVGLTSAHLNPFRQPAQDARRFHGPARPWTVNDGRYATKMSQLWLENIETELGSNASIGSVAATFKDTNVGYSRPIMKR